MIRLGFHTNGSFSSFEETQKLGFDNWKKCKGKCIQLVSKKVYYRMPLEPKNPNQNESCGAKFSDGHFLEDFGQKKCSCGPKKCFFGKKCPITWYILHIIRNWICKFAIALKSDAFAAKIANTRPTKTLVAIFALAEICHPAYSLTYWQLEMKRCKSI